MFHTGSVLPHFANQCLRLGLGNSWAWECEKVSTEEVFLSYDPVAANSVSSYFALILRYNSKKEAT